MLVDDPEVGADGGGRGGAGVVPTGFTSLERRSPRPVVEDDESSNRRGTPARTPRSGGLAVSRTCWASESCAVGVLIISCSLWITQELILDRRVSSDPEQSIWQNQRSKREEQAAN